MVDTDWKTRLDEALKNSGRSARDVSMSIGRAPGYIHSLSLNDRQPSVKNIVAICGELNVSVLWILYGIDMDDDTQELLKIFSQLPEEGRKSLLNTVRSLLTLNK